jgi:spoIIIJ-associated protein
MEWVETTGKTVAEAVDVALDQLGVHEADVEYEVLQEPKAGLFGRFGGTEARVRARVKPVSREKPGDRRRRSAKKDGPRGDSPERKGERPKSRSPRGGNQKRRSGAARPEGVKQPSAPIEEKPVSPVSEVPVEDQADTAADFVSGLVTAFGMAGDVDYTIDEDDAIHLDVEGSNLGYLVGPRGNTLNAIEELVRTVVQRRADGNGARIFVDVAGYRAKRREALGRFATDLGEKVLDSGETEVLEPMSAADRKVVHDTIADIAGLETISDGVEPRRHVVIRPV